MKQIIYTFGLFLSICSCSSNNRPETVHNITDTGTNSTELLEQLSQIPDTVLVSHDQKNKVFRLNLTGYKIDFLKTKKLNGEWFAIGGQLNFLNTTLEPKDKVVFKDSNSEMATGWGTLLYNRSAKFYFTESGSNIYEYYIDEDGQLNLIQLEYRNDDLTFKEKPAQIIEQLPINWIDDSQIELTLNGHKILLKK